jgi:hypothetical protein
MSRYHIVTTCHEAGYAAYGVDFLQSFVRFAGPDIGLTWFYEGKCPETRDSRICYQEIGKNDALAEFRQQYGDRDHPTDYRRQGVRFAPKVFAYTAAGEGMRDWLLWFDADVEFTARFGPETFDAFLPQRAYCAYLGRKDWDHSECGFIGFNLRNDDSHRFLQVIREEYETGKIFSYPQWHDSYIFDQIVDRVCGSDTNICKGATGDHVWPQSPLASFSVHKKGPVRKQKALMDRGYPEDVAAEYISEDAQTDPVTPQPDYPALETRQNTGPIRYHQLIDLIEATQPTSIVEVGTWNGNRAIEMCREALRHQEKVSYIGFDLFEQATHETDARELNVKTHGDEETVRDKLTHFQTRMLEDHGRILNFTLIAGDSRETLPRVQSFGGIDLAFIDGGHSVETIESDFNHLKDHAKLIILDDFYEPDDDGSTPDVSKYGCNKLLSNTPHTLLPFRDPVKDGGYVRMALVGEVPTNINIAPARTDGKIPLDLHTMNCVEHEVIQANVQHCFGRREREIYAGIDYLQFEIDRLRKMQPVRFLPYCKPHLRNAVFVSGGPSIMDASHPDHDQLWAELKELHVGRHITQTDLVCVKHSHDKLIANNIIPKMCILLDPRGHVAEFIEHPHREVTYLVSSMCDPQVLDHMLEHSNRVWSYHASVNAGEVDVIAKNGGGEIIAGGTTSATRGLMLLSAMLGYVNFKFYGMDSCYWQRPQSSESKIYDVTVAGKEFISDGELIAQCQDFEKAMRAMPHLNISVHGPGMIPHVATTLVKPKVDIAQIFNAAR